MEKELKFSEDTVSRSCRFCAELSAGVVEGKSGDFTYNIPHCASHEKAAEKKVLELIGENGME